MKQNDTRKVKLQSITEKGKNEKKQLVGFNAGNEEKGSG